MFYNGRVEDMRVRERNAINRPAGEPIQFTKEAYVHTYSPGLDVSGCSLQFSSV